MSYLGLLPHDIWTIAIAVMAAMTCSLLGTFLVARRLSLLGDSISHAILPGIAIAFLLTSSRSFIPMLIGAFGAGLTTVLATQFLTHFGRIRDDAAMGIVFSSLFAIGVIIITLAARNVDLDPGCVLYGLLELAPFDTISVLGVDIPRAFLTISIIGTISLIVIVLLFKELKLSAFDPAFANSVGINSTIIHYIFMTLVAAACVAAFEAVGSILVIALLISPPAAALLCCKRLENTLALSTLFGAISAIVGYLASVQLNTSSAGAIASTSGVLFFLVFLINYRSGVIFQLFRRIKLRLRILTEDLLGELYRKQESGKDLELKLDGFSEKLALFYLKTKGLITTNDKLYQLTPSGLLKAQEVIRSHRLWESYLSTNLPLAEDHLHAPSHRAEHFISSDTLQSLNNELKTELDPHGRKIPNSERD